MVIKLLSNYAGDPDIVFYLQFLFRVSVIKIFQCCRLTECNLDQYHEMTLISYFICSLIVGRYYEHSSEISNLLLQYKYDILFLNLN